MILSDEEVRSIFMANGFTIKDGQTDLKPYVYASAKALERAVLDKASKQEPICYLIDDGYSKTTTKDAASLKIAKRFNWAVTPLYAAPPQAAAIPEVHNISEIKRTSDQSVTVVFTSCRAASAFANALSAAPKPEQNQNA